MSDTEVADGTTDLPEDLAWLVEDRDRALRSESGMEGTDLVDKHVSEDGPRTAVRYVGRNDGGERGFEVVFSSSSFPAGHDVQDVFGVDDVSSWVANNPVERTSVKDVQRAAVADYGGFSL